MTWLWAFYRGMMKILMRGFRRRMTPWSPPESLTPGGVWFHAASLGELETLWPLIREAAAERTRIVVTVFSASAHAGLRRLREEIRKDFGVDILGGDSPHEGNWKTALERVRPRVFVTAKYEAWPDLWASASRLGIPIVVVATAPRPAFRIAKICLRLFGVPLPRLLLTLPNRELESECRRLLPEATVAILPDPRWDRVASRLHQSRRGEEWAERHSAYPRPWGIVGSVWPADLRVILGAFPGDGSLFLFPHVLSPDMKSELEELLRTVPGASERSVIIMEPGILAECYRVADWAFVGGGFGAGVHSTIEPAMAGLPVCAGPARMERFPETQALRALGILTRIEESEDFASWIQKSAGPLGFEGRQERIRRVSSLCGGGSQTWKALQPMLR